jgi:hypothetical protein
LRRPDAAPGPDRRPPVSVGADAVLVAKAQTGSAARAARVGGIAIADLPAHAGPAGLSPHASPTLHAIARSAARDARPAPTRREVANRTVVLGAGIRGDQVAELPRGAACRGRADGIAARLWRCRRAASVWRVADLDQNGPTARDGQRSVGAGHSAGTVERASTQGKAVGQARPQLGNKTDIPWCAVIGLLGRACQ